MSDERRSHIVEIVPAPAESRPARVAYDEETRARCFVLYATFAARNCAAVARLYAEEVKSLDLPAPDVRTLQHWANDEQWNAQADTLWRHTKGRTSYELQILSQANTMQGAKALHDILTGLDTRDLNERVITLKAIEVAMKAREKLPELARIEPPEETLDTDGLSKQDIEANAMNAITRGRKGKG